jgi:hypothetical protein
VLSLTPVVAGTGRRLFDDPGHIVRLGLTDSTTFETSAVRLFLKPDPAQGTSGGVAPSSLSSLMPLGHQPPSSVAFCSSAHSKAFKNDSKSGGARSSPILKLGRFVTVSGPNLVARPSWLSRSR